MDRLKLTIEPMPSASALASLAKLLPGPEWNRIRRAAYKRAGYHCQICAYAGPLSCHEVWFFSELTQYQWLMGFQALCDGCHGVKHILSVRNREVFRNLANHFMAVNNVGDQEFKAHLRAARARRAELSKHRWRIGFDRYAFRVPALRTLEERKRYLRLDQPRARPIGW